LLNRAGGKVGVRVILKILRLLWRGGGEEGSQEVEGEEGHEEEGQNCRKVHV